MSQPPEPTQDTPRKVAILGGGPSGLAAAFELSDPCQGGRYEVTVYQLGWRLGGKCASGRNAAHHDRVQEHGLHVFLGSYDNTFDLVRRAYDELDRKPGQPLASWEEALHGIDDVGLMERVGDSWQPWVVKVPHMPGSPGDPHDKSVFHLLESLLKWIGMELERLAHHFDHSDRKEPGFEKPHWWDRLVSAVFPGAGHHAAARMLGAATTMTGDLAGRVGQHEQQHHDHLASLLHRIRTWIHEGLPETLEDEFRHFVIVADLMLTNGIGALRDGLVFAPERNLPRVNRLDYRDWLRGHDALDMTVESAIVRGLYDLIFAYPDGDVTRPGEVEAGTMFVSLTQTSRYHGAFMYKMMAGTGDVVVGPLYEVMRRRGVQFRFFHRIVELIPSEDGAWIDRVLVSRQVKLKGDSYAPLVDIRGLPCWPSEPLYDQIEEGERLRDERIDLESRWTPWQDTGGDLELRFGRDYDALVLATSLEPLHDLCGKLADRRNRWRVMLDSLDTVQTQSAQLWFKPSLRGGGDDSGDGVGMPGAINPGLVNGLVLGAYDRDVQPIDTWADISEVLAVETWPAGTIGNESIVCGPMKGPRRAPPAGERDFPARSAARLEGNLGDFIERNGPALWPGLYPNGQFSRDALADRYLRVNIDPSERYVLTRPGTTTARLRTQDAGFDNLFLAGDWIQNGQNLGSFEASIASGKLASRAISGLPRTIARIPADSPLYADRPAMPASAMPSYVEHPFRQTFAGPVELANTRMWSFWVQGDRSRLERICRDYFAVPSQGQVQYEPLTSRLLVSVVDIGHGRFIEAPEMGWSSERELAFWMLLVKVREEGGVRVAERLGLFNPLLVLDNPVAVATGRETYGYLKQLGWIDVPAADDGSGGITVDAFATARFGPDSEQRRQRFLSLEPIASAGGKPHAEWHGLEAVADMLRDALEADIELALPSSGLLRQLFDDLVHREMPQVFLKQFRDVEDTRKACYQAIIETPIRVRKPHAVRFDTGWDLRIEALDSLDVTGFLGVEREQRIDAMVQLQMDMVLDTGRVIWKAP